MTLQDTKTTNIFVGLLRFLTLPRRGMIRLVKRAPTNELSAK